MPLQILWKLVIIMLFPSTSKIHLLRSPSLAITSCSLHPWLSPPALSILGYRVKFQDLNALACILFMINKHNFLQRLGNNDELNFQDVVFVSNLITERYRFSVSKFVQNEIFVHYKTHRKTLPFCPFITQYCLSKCFTDMTEYPQTRIAQRDFLLSCSRINYHGMVDGTPWVENFVPTKGQIYPFLATPPHQPSPTHYSPPSAPRQSARRSASSAFRRSTRRSSAHSAHHPPSPSEAPSAQQPSHGHVSPLHQLSLAQASSHHLSPSIFEYGSNGNGILGNSHVYWS